MTQNRARDLFAELRDDYKKELPKTCYICGQKKEFMEIHHKTPLSLGGGNLLNNLILLCSDCHKRVHKIRKSNPTEKDLNDRLIRLKRFYK